MSREWCGGVRWVGMAAVIGLALAGGCQRPQTKAPKKEPPEVEVSLPVVQEITDYEDFTGQTAAVHSVQVRARVTGYLQKVHFKEGMEVKQGELLFEIDPRPYAAALDKANALLLQATARLERLKVAYQRALTLPADAISPDELDKIRGEKMEAEASVKAAKASQEMARLDLEFTKVTAPISGRISRKVVDPGNLVKADETLLTSIVSLDPIHAYFDVDERTVLKLRRLLREGKIKSARETQVAIYMGLVDEEGFPHKGVIDFIDNRIDPGTGTLNVRARFDNADRLLSPGLFARLRLPVGSPYKAVLVSERALGTDQGQKFVYVVAAKQETDQRTGATAEVQRVEYRKVKVGPLHNGMRVIEKGLAADEKVIVSGLQRVRPAAAVRAKVVPMPSLTNGNGKVILGPEAGSATKAKKQP